jgi:hypothetical protein
MGRTAASVSSVLGLWIVLTLSGCADSVVSPNLASEGDLVTLAKAALDEKNAALVGGWSQARSDEAPSALYAVAIQEDLSEISARRAALLQEGHSYTGFMTTLNVQRSEVRANEATLIASEHTVLSQVVKDVLGVPPTTEYVQDHVFRFAKRKGTWHLVEDELVNTLQSEDPLAQGLHLEPVSIPGEDAGWEFGVNPSESSHPSMALFGGGESVSKAAVVSYAYQYWQNYNRNYRSFPKDCTNFVSQAVRHGGWSRVFGYALYKYPTVWYYDSVTQSWSWVNANVWFGFVNSRPRARWMSDFTKLVPGDVIQADWERDGIIDHTMIVTSKDNSGSLYLTYHSNNNKDKPFNDLRATYRGAVFYGWSLYGS